MLTCWIFIYTHGLGLTFHPLIQVYRSRALFELTAPVVPMQAGRRRPRDHYDLAAAAGQYSS